MPGLFGLWLCGVFGFGAKGANNPLGGIRNPNMALPLGIVIAVLVYQTHLQALSEQIFTIDHSTIGYLGMLQPSYY